MDKKKKLFESLNDFFDQIYLITLKRSKDRHPIIRKTLEGLDYKTFWAVDGRELDLDKLAEDGVIHPPLTKILKKRAGQVPRNLSPSMIGCALSHTSVWKDMIENNYQKILVFEDDIDIDIAAADHLNDAFSELPEDWEFLFLGHFGANSDPTPLLRIQKNILSFFAKRIQRFERLRSLDPEVIRCWFARPYSENLDISGYHYGSHAYGLTMDGSKKILKYTNPIVQQQDDCVAELCSYQWIKSFNLKKRIFYQNRNLPSTISS